MKLLLLWALSLFSISVLSSEEGTRWYLRISHIGPEDGHMNSLIISCEAIRPQTVDNTFFDTAVVVPKDLFDSLNRAILLEQSRSQWKPSDGKVAYEVGSFEIRDSYLGKKEKSFSWMLSRKQSNEVFRRLLSISKTAESGSALTKELELRAFFSDGLGSK